MSDVSQLLSGLQKGDSVSITRALTLVENELIGSQALLEQLPFNNHIPLIGITGPPGAGKSTLLNSLVEKLLQRKNKIGIIAVDPSSPFNHGALLGDRIRLSQYFNNPDVFIRSVASRGSLGGLSEKVLELSEVMRAGPFDYIFIETVGVGQSEVEIAGLADQTIVVLVPESGDEVQTMKAGLMEIADLFVVNKCDHTNADLFVASLQTLVAEKMNKSTIPVIKTIATTGEGVDLLISFIDEIGTTGQSDEKRIRLIAEKIKRIIIKDKMKLVSDQLLFKEVKSAIQQPGFNAYQFAKKYF